MVDIAKKTGVILLLVAIVVAVASTFFILNYIQTLKIVEGPSESGSSGEVTLTVTEPSITKDEEAGSVSLNVLPPGDQK